MVEELSEALIPNLNKTRIGAKAGRSGSKFESERCLNRDGQDAFTYPSSR